MLSPLILGIWYPYPLRNVLDMDRVVWIFFSVQIVIAVMLPVLLIRHGKTEKAIFVDWLLIIGIQVFVLVAGIYVLYNGRPVVIVFEQDRFVVVQANEVVWAAKEKKSAYDHRRYFIPQWVGVDLDVSKTTVIELLAQSLQGVEPSQREDLWVDYAKLTDRIQSASRPVSDLNAMEYDRYFVKSKKLYESKMELLGSLVYLPFTSSKNKDWIAILNDSGYPVEFAPIDGFK